jgi:hypothetical protein
MRKFLCFVVLICAVALSQPVVADDDFVLLYEFNGSAKVLEYLQAQIIKKFQAKKFDLVPVVGKGADCVRFDGGKFETRHIYVCTFNPDVGSEMTSAYYASLLQSGPNSLEMQVSALYITPFFSCSVATCNKAKDPNKHPVLTPCVLKIEPGTGKLRCWHAGSYNGIPYNHYCDDPL